MSTPDSQTRSGWGRLNEPVLAYFLRDRRLSLILFAVGAGQLLLSGFGLPAWPCPMLKATGIPCAGCGLTRSILAALRGDWVLSLRLHAFGILSLGVLVLLLGVSMTPARVRLPLISRIDAFERRTAVGAVLVIGLFVYWGGRLLHF